MPSRDESLYDALKGWAESHRIEVRDRHLPTGTVGEFTGVVFTMNPDFSFEERAWYFAHALGSVVIWSRDPEAVQRMFDELRDAKANPSAGSERLDRAIKWYREFEGESSDYAVWLLDELGHAEDIPAYTNFMRADLESMTEFHRTGRAPVWREFFARWNEDVSRGKNAVFPFQLKPIPPFDPVVIEKQSILQRQ